jgi:Flp pilus assembly protein TadB
LSGGIIGGIVVGVLAGAALFSAALFLLIRRRRSQVISRDTATRDETKSAAKMLTQANTHELQTPPQPTGVELGDMSRQEPRIHELDAGLR